MAIKVNIKTENGVVVSYHRIPMVAVEVGQQVTILVHSYLNAEGREYDKDYAAGRLTEEYVMPYINGEYMHIPWDSVGDMLKGDLIQNAYNWLKKQPQFIGAEDV